MSDQRPPDAEQGDARVGRSLRALPPAEASARFTEGVLARLREAAASGRRRRWWLPAFAAAALVGGLVAALRPERSSPPGAPEVATLGDELAELRRAQRQLVAEIESLQTEDAEAPLPVIYVGRSAGVDLVLDLGRFQTAFPRGTRTDPRLEGGE
jgi:hypothetical protein